MNENRPNPRTATPGEKGSTAIGLKNELCTLSFALKFAMMLYPILNIQPIFMRIHPSLPTMHFISSVFLHSVLFTI